ncbi:MAG: FAD-dependent oxidoreductase, partial [Enterocloster clostridioformis]|nr:FAD-dependent oxidoreductase [Enterocloster clostridioformis]
HSARDTFETLLARGIPMEPKAFAVGLRVQHPQTLINESQYGIKECGELGPASYKLTWKSSDERGVYSFCMCPGGYVVNASSEPGRLAVNGMSYHDRAGENANSAIIVTVTPEDFGGIEAESGMEAESGTERGCEAPGDAMAGIRFQRRLEEAAFCLGKGSIPVQLYGDFKAGRVSDGFGGVNPAFQGGYAFANLRELFPEPLSRAFMEGMEGFGTMIRGFDRPDAILAGIESRTSSPVRIPRDQGMESPVKGIFPCGEGAGYAGGITSAAMDGIKTAEEIIRRYSPLSPS